jgi:hypothetical protein
MASGVAMWHQFEKAASFRPGWLSVVLIDILSQTIFPTAAESA